MARQTLTLRGLILWRRSETRSALRGCASHDALEEVGRAVADGGRRRLVGAMRRCAGPSTGFKFSAQPCDIVLIPVKVSEDVEEERIQVFNRLLLHCHMRLLDLEDFTSDQIHLLYLSGDCVGVSYVCPRQCNAQCLYFDVRSRCCGRPALRTRCGPAPGAPAVSSWVPDPASHGERCT